MLLRAHESLNPALVLANSQLNKPNDETRIIENIDQQEYSSLKFFFTDFSLCQFGLVISKGLSVTALDILSAKRNRLEPELFEFPCSLDMIHRIKSKCVSLMRL